MLRREQLSGFVAKINNTVSFVEMVKLNGIDLFRLYYKFVSAFYTHSPRGMCKESYMALSKEDAAKANIVV